jgi:hypothetical protein
MSMFEVLYGRNFRVPISHDSPVDRIKLGPELLKEMEYSMVKIRNNLKVTQDIRKSYEDSKTTHRELKVGDNAYLRVKPKRSSMRMGMCAKLEPCYCVPFEVLERIGPVAYRLALPPNVRVHNVFHVYFLKKYVHDSNHVIDWTVIHMEQEGEFQPKPQCIMDKRETMS